MACGDYKIMAVDDRTCAEERFCCNVRLGPASRLLWARNKRLATAWIDGEVRVVVWVAVRPGRRRKPRWWYWMDAITGSFYGAESLRCLTQPDFALIELHEGPHAANVLRYWKPAPIGFFDMGDESESRCDEE